MTSHAKNPRTSKRLTGAVAVALAATTALLAGCSSSDDASDNPLTGKKSSGGTVVVGSNNFPPESTLLADLYGEALKAKGVKVTYKPNIGSRETTYGLIKNGTLTLLPPEYNGGAAGLPRQEGRPEVGRRHHGRDHRQARSRTHPAGALARRGQGLRDRQPADREQVPPHREVLHRRPQGHRGGELVIGGSPEFQTRRQGLEGLKSVYGLRFKSFKALDAGGPLTQTALKKNVVQVADLFTTDPTISREKFVTLQDTKSLFGFQNVQPLVRKGACPSRPSRRSTPSPPSSTRRRCWSWTPRCSRRRRTRWRSRGAWLKSAGLS